jgi:hypothetical protein
MFAASAGAQSLWGTGAAAQSYPLINWSQGNLSYASQPWDLISLINNDMTNDPNNFVSIYFEANPSNEAGETTGRIALVPEGTETYQSAFVFLPRGTSNFSLNEVMRISGSGNVGIGTAGTPTSSLQVASITTSGTNGYGLSVAAPSGATNNYAAAFTGGNVGIGTTTPGAALEVNGGVKLTSGSGASITFQDGTTQSTAFIPANCGADFAESVGVGSDRAQYEPGDLMVIDPDKPGSFLKSNQPYSTLVAGVYSTKPGFVGRLHPAGDPASAGEVPMAMVGRVPTKVSAENGPIKVGDLLVTSSTPGYAMKGTDHDRMLGAVIGKALGPLDSGTGIIEVLVTLQ